MAARRVLRGIYGEELEAELRRQGLDIDSRTFAVPRFGAAKYQGLSDTDLLQQFRERVDSAEPDSCLVKQRRSSGQTRLEQIVALAEDDCESWLRDVYRGVCSNPNPEREYKYTLLGESRERTAYYGNCNHMFTLLLDWDQVTTWLIKQAQWLNGLDGGIRLYLRTAPAAPPSSLSDQGASDGLLCADRLSDADRRRGDMIATFITAARSVSVGQNRWSCRSNPVWDMLRSRLDLPFHARLNDESVYHTLTYLWHHMKCGVYIKIRQNRLAMFVPFHNLEYRNAWAKAAEKHLPGSREFGQTLEDYYAEKCALCNRDEAILSDISRWWANGNILCNQQVSGDENERSPHFWGDAHLPQMKDMIQKTCETRTVKDCDFFLNKRDYPQLKSDLSEPYDFLYEEDRPPLSREKHDTYAPILSYYTSPQFADIPFPCGEDWMTAIGDFFPPKATANFMKENSENFEQKVDRAAQAAGKSTWEMKRSTAIFRGSGTGGGNMPDDNQRLMLHKLSEEWQTDSRYNSQNGVDGVPYLDASCVQWNFRDKKLKGKNMTFFRAHDTGLTRGDYVPMFEQVQYKYHIYAEGHCAANRYAQMMRLGCVIIKVTSQCKASELWFFPALVPYQDHVPVKADLSDLAEQIEWCKTHDRECQQIAKRSRELYNELFSEEGIKDYCALIFSEISFRFSQGQPAQRAAQRAPNRSSQPQIPVWDRSITGPAGMRSGDHGRLQIPAGWLECPEAGTPLLLDGLLFLPCKAPVGPQFAEILQPGSHFSPADIVKYMRARYNREVGLVINLSSTEKWYNPQQDWPPVVEYVHLDCGTRGDEKLDGKSANAFCWAITKFRKKEEVRCRAGANIMPRSIVVHCTHGHNRTGFMLCAYMLRMRQWHAINHSVSEVAAAFSKSRPPGIYKPDVLAALYRLYLERIPPTYPCPKPPHWKGDMESRSELLADAIPPTPARPTGGMQHDDLIGEEVPSDLAEAISRLVYFLVTGKEAASSGPAAFPGNHPVNLTRSNINNLKQQHLVTWKADGTRYLMLVMPEGAFLVSRNTTMLEMVRRVHIRCPRSDGSLHSQTLLDGELVVDTDKKTKQQKRRFLVYDVLSSGSDKPGAQVQRFADKPFSQRHSLIKQEFVLPYNEHRLGKLKIEGYRHKYDWDAEEFTIRRKDFFPIENAAMICNDMIPKFLPHESDGLIFQPAHAEYREGRCADLFKWKYAHLNSVDFFFKGGKLFLGGNGMGQGAEEMPGFRAVVDPLRQNEAPNWPHAYDGHTIECVWVDAYLTEPGHSCPLPPDGEGSDPRTWVFLRDRMGKGANGRKTYEGIMESVRNRITQHQMIKSCDEIRAGKKPAVAVEETVSKADLNRQKMKEHYDHTVQAVGSDYKGNRERSKSFALRRYHNDIKRAMTARFARNAPKVLDLASGRGGDLAKWADQGVGYVLGLDISPGECEEANRRYMEMRNQGKMGHLVAEYRQSDDVGVKVLYLVDSTPTPAQAFNVVSCMFAFHYFFADLLTLKTFLKTVSDNLCEGGIFMGCLPDGLRIKELVEESGIFENEMVTIKKKWDGKAAPFGSTYTMAIVDTVTGIVGEDDEGSEEYLAMLNSLLVGLAAKADLRVVANYSNNPDLLAEGRALEQLLDPDDVASDASFKHFFPPFSEEQPDLAYASLVNATFVFQKVGSNPSASQPSNVLAQHQQPAANVATQNVADDDAADDGDGWGDLGAGEIDGTDEPMDSEQTATDPASTLDSDGGAPDAAESQLQPMPTPVAEDDATPMSTTGVVAHATAAKMERSTSAAKAFLAANRMETGGKTPSVAIIVCFRIQRGQRREAELQEFMPHMRKMLGKLQADGEIKKYHIFVIQQKSSQDEDGVKFNRGKLLNIGFEIAVKARYDSFVFHDVDLLPNEDLSLYYACVPTVPIHIAACWHERGYTANKFFFGGIVSFSKLHFTQVNGYPNNFWGWGGEDEVIMDRCTTHRIVPHKVQDGCLTDIEKNAEGETMDMPAKLEWLKRNEQWKCDDRWERRAADKTGWNTNGLNTLVAPLHPYAELQREDISDLSAASTGSKQKKLKKLGKVGTRIVVDLLYDEADGKREDTKFEAEMNAKRKALDDSDMDAESSAHAKRPRSDGAD